MKGRRPLGGRGSVVQAGGPAVECEAGVAVAQGGPAVLSCGDAGGHSCSEEGACWGHPDEGPLSDSLGLVSPEP